MIEDRRQLAMAGGHVPVAGDSTDAQQGGLLVWVARHVTPVNVRLFADRHRWLLWGVMVCFYLAAFNGQWRIQSDAALYLSIGRNLAHGAGFTYLGEPNHLAYPGWPGLIALVFKTFGADKLFPVNALMTLISLATVAMVYRLFLLHSGRSTAVVISLGVGLTKAFFCYGFELWTDMPFALGAMSVLAGYEGLFGRHHGSGEGRFYRTIWQRGIDWFFLIGGIIFAGAMRPTIWPLLAALGLAIVAETFRKRIQWRVLVGLGAVVLVMGIVVFSVSWIRADLHRFGSVYQDYLLNRITGKPAGAMDGSLVGNINSLFSWAASDVLFQARFGAVCNAMLSTLVLGLGFWLFRVRLLWGFWFCLLLATILVSQEVLDRYFLPVLPLLVYAWWELLVSSYRNARRWMVLLDLPAWTPSALFLTLVLFGCISNVTKVGGIIMQQRQQPFLAGYDKGTYDTIPRFTRLLSEHVGDKAIVLVSAPYGRVTQYLSDRYATSEYNVTLQQMREHPIFVVEPSDLATHTKLRDAGLVEGPAVFTVVPSANHGPSAVALSLHSTHRVK